MKISIHLIMLILIGMAIVILLFPTLFPKKYEAFDNITGYYPLSNTISRDEYTEIGKKRFNPYSDPVDLLSPGLMGLNITSQQRAALNADLQNATSSTQLMSSTYNPQTMMIPSTVGTKNAVPPMNQTLEKIKKCESQVGRDKCSILDDPEFSDCGVCVQNGSDVFDKKPENYSGGLFITKKDKTNALNNPTNTSLLKPSAGNCPAGYFFLNSADCKKAVNILKCKEISDSGGFSGGKTREDNLTANQANCAKCGPDSSTFVYMPPEYAKSNIQLRVLVPQGSGANYVRVFDISGNLLGSGININNETEFTIQLSQQIAEAQSVQIVVNQEFPHRPAISGRSEVFYADLGETKFTQTILNKKAASGDISGKQEGLTFDEANALCTRMGCQIATPEQIRAAKTAGLQVCNYGFASDGKAYSSALASNSTQTCSVTEGVNLYKGTGTKEYAGVWCYGIKPPTGRYISNDFDFVIKLFFNTFANNSTPSQDTLPNKTSQFGNNFIAPNYRGVLLQWESADIGTTIGVPVDSTIKTINAMAPSTDAGDGITMLRRKGTYDLSQQISLPKPEATSRVGPKSYWYWSNDNSSPTISIVSALPGVFKVPFYQENRSMCVGKPLIANKSTLDLLRVSVCNRSSETPGNYSLDCLKDLFKSVGGDLTNGTLSPTKSEANRILLNSQNDLNSISAYLQNIYQIATTGYDMRGLPAGATQVAQKQAINSAFTQLFGRTLISPCEETFVGPDGRIMIRDVTGPFPSDCLNYLYTNAGFESSRGSEGTAKIRNVGATYTSIADRFSGMIRGDMGNASMKAAHPFRTCQPTGTISPIKSDGTDNADAILAANAAGSTIQNIQNFYNTIYQNANTSYTDDIVSPELAEKQQLSIQQCYGIQKMDDSTVPSGCGVRTRYVRILPVDTGEFKERNSSSAGPFLIISQLQVIDPRGTNVALNKSVTYNSIHPQSRANKAIDGKSVSGRGFITDMYVSAYGSYNEYFMIDLQRPVDVRTVIYTFGIHNRTIIEYVYGYTIQLLDDNKKVVIQKVINRNDIQTNPSDNVSFAVKHFNKEDMMNASIVRNLQIGQTLSLVTIGRIFDSIDMKINPINITLSAGTIPGSVRIQNGSKFYGINWYDNVVITNATATDKNYKDWYITSGINGAQNTISIQSANSPGIFIGLPTLVSYNFYNTVNINGTVSDSVNASASLLALTIPGRITN